MKVKQGLMRSAQWGRARAYSLAKKSLWGYKLVFIAQIPEVLREFKPIVFSKVSLDIPVGDVLSKLSLETELAVMVMCPFRINLREALDIVREKRGKTLFIKLTEIREHSVNCGERILMMNIENRGLANFRLGFSLSRKEFLKYGEF